ncbi:MAG: class I SAM-dependent methyltransferase [Proteobacteria bacterium]|nr:class I SAM-dependent methyltransferase [Pseudomonadota bacterium]MBU1583881.1 class I SAM-dependent methyltransferase [Pseudomonadota bacterium]MBU2452350.1 class I SAM-dependent methyltransferase [Pseudomonadota bacterium]MBU2632065.1 class I SAM-dependent methyltransferase [Pseudomonadota bacterium]
MNPMQTIYNHAKTVSIFQQLCSRFNSVQGFLSQLEGFALYLLATMGPGQGEVVEIGSYKGLSTCWIAEGLKASNREQVTAVDHFEGSDEHSDEEKKDLLEIFLANISEQGLNDYVIPTKMSSENAVQKWHENGAKPIRLLFIDGDHSYEGVKKDFNLWSELLIESGIVCFHDYQSKGYPGVTRFVDELLVHSSRYGDVMNANALKVIQIINGNHHVD